MVHADNGTAVISKTRKPEPNTQDEVRLGSRVKVHINHGPTKMYIVGGKTEGSFEGLPVGAALARAIIGQRAEQTVSYTVGPDDERVSAKILSIVNDSTN